MAKARYHNILLKWLHVRFTHYASAYTWSVCSIPIIQQWSNILSHLIIYRELQFRIR